MTTTRPVSAADKLVQVLAEHHWDIADWSVHKPLNLCTCGQRIGTSEGEFTAHQAAVVLAHLTAEGWAQGHEEWGYRYREHTHVARNRQRAEEMAFIYAGKVFRRRVTDWEPVEGEQR